MLLITSKQLYAADSANSEKYVVVIIIICSM